MDAVGAIVLRQKLTRSQIGVQLSIPLAAIKTKSGEQPPLPPEVRENYGEARLKEDVKLTPAA